LGLEAKGGLMERAERIILLCLGLLIPVLLVPILWVMLVLTAFTAVQRFVRVWNQANAATVVLERQAARRQRRIARRSARSRRWSELRRNRGV
jgi:CDP-diacylglycerol--glycerol-3-phosphate 3-phosphatidyltransferase